VTWPVVPLSKALEHAEVFVDGDWVESKDQDPNGDVRLIQLADIGDGEYVDKSSRFLTSAKAKALKCTYLKPGDVLVARMPDPLGRACIYPGDQRPAVTVVDVCIIRPNGGGPDSRYLMHCLNAAKRRHQIGGFATGTTRSRISRSNLAKIEIPLPPLPEQQRIADILNKADGLRAKRRATLAQLDTLKQSIFLNMFGDPRKNEKGWPTSTIESVVSDVRGGAALEPEDFVEQGCPILHKGAIKPGGRIAIDSRKKTFTTWAYASANSRCFADRDFVAVTLRDLVPTGPTIGLAADLRKGPFDKYLLAQGAYAFKPDPKALTAEYFVQLSNMPNFRHLLRQNAVGSTQIHIRTPVYMAIRIPIPPVRTQREFSLCLATTEAIETRQRETLTEFDFLMASLQMRAFGESFS